MKNSICRSLIICIILLIESTAFADCPVGNIVVGISKGGSKYFYNVTFMTYCISFPNGDVSLLTTEDIPRRDDHADLSNLPFRKEWHKQDNSTDMLNKNSWLVGLLKYRPSYPSYEFSFSSEGNLVAFRPDYYSDEGKRTLSIYDVSTKKEITTIISPRRIEATAWSADSKYIAVLTVTTRFGLWPHEMLFMIAGHPIPYESFYLDVYDLSGKRILTEKMIDKNLKGGVGSVIWLREKFPLP